MVAQTFCQTLTPASDDSPVNQLGAAPGDKVAVPITAVSPSHVNPKFPISPRRPTSHGSTAHDLRSRRFPGPANSIRPGQESLITANYLAAGRKVHMIKKIGTVCPIYDVDSSLDDEFSVYLKAKSPSGQISI